MPALTRRHAIGAGLAVASAACVNGIGAYAATARTRAIDAMLIDDTVAMPADLADAIRARRPDLPIVTIGLDAAGQAGLRQTLGEGGAIVGISSGATLFCLERMAWDHGFRLTARSQRAMRDTACTQDVAAFLAGASPAGAVARAHIRTYRPSRADSVLHVWALHKAGAMPWLQIRQDV